MRKWLLLVLLFLPLAVWAQTAPVIEWTHDGANVTYFDCTIDAPGGTDFSGAVSLSGLVTQNGTTYTSNLSNCGTLSSGQHTLVIRACNTGGCTPGTAIYVVKL